MDDEAPLTNAAPLEERERLETLRVKIERGEYRVPADDIAGSIVDEHLDAGAVDKDKRWKRKKLTR